MLPRRRDAGTAMFGTGKLGGLLHVRDVGDRMKRGLRAAGLRQSRSGMPMALALSARLSVTPQPGNTTRRPTR
jgi:hypothetical protein